MEGWEEIYIISEHEMNARERLQIGEYWILDFYFLPCYELYIYTQADLDEDL